jgi:hypothetical protein
MEKLNPKLPNWVRKPGWLWFAIAVIGILQTPDAVISAVHSASSDHRLAPILVLAFAIRVVMIWLFLKFWWDSRSAKEAPNS